jgi:tetratricopeptide (TPR) repeat protein
MTRIRRALPFALLLALAFAGTLYAAGEGRVLGTVVDPEGKPVAGAKVTVTYAETNYKQEKTTDAKGKFTMLILDATKTYRVRVEKQGFKPFEDDLKPKVEDTVRVNLSIVPEEPEAVPAGGPQAKELEGKNQAIAAYNEGVGLLRTSDLAGAAAKFEEAVKLDPKLAPAWAVLSEIYSDQKKHAEALAAADKYLEIEPGAVRGLKVRYDAFLALGKTDQLDAALAELAKVDRTPDTAVRIVNRGITHFNENRMPQAIQAFETALSVDPTLAKAEYLLGLSYVNSDNKEKAREHLTKFLEMAPNDENAGTAQEMLKFLKQ